MIYIFSLFPELFFFGSKGEAAEKAIAEMKALEAKEKHEQYERDIQLAEEMERAGQLEEDGDFWLRCCPCCADILVRAVSYFSPLFSPILLIFIYKLPRDRLKYFF